MGWSGRGGCFSFQDRSSVHLEESQRLLRDSSEQRSESIGLWMSCQWLALWEGRNLLELLGQAQSKGLYRAILWGFLGELSPEVRAYPVSFNSRL